MMKICKLRFSLSVINVYSVSFRLINYLQVQFPCYLLRKFATVTDPAQLENVVVFQNGFFKYNFF